MKGLLCLKWNNHSIAFDKLLNNLHLKDIYSDGTLMCQGKFYPIHRFVLSTCSGYFEEIFNQCMEMECKHPFIIVKDIQPTQMEALLNYMYRGEVNVPQEMLPDLIKAAEAFKIKGLAVPDDDPLPSAKSLIRDKKRSSESPCSNVNKSRKYDNCKITETKNKDCDDLDDLGSTKTNIQNINVNIDASLRPSEDKSKLFQSSDIEIFGSASNINNDDIIKTEPVDTKELPSETSDVETVSTSKIKEEIQSYSYSDDNNDAADFFDATQSSSWEDSNTYDIDDLEEESSQRIYGMSNFSNLPSSITNSTLQRIKHFACNLCSFKTISRTNLKVHIRKHTGEKPYLCSICPYKGAQQANLQTHMKTHSGIKPFKCSHCEFRTAYKHRLTSHFRCHNSNN